MIDFYDNNINLNSFGITTICINGVFIYSQLRESSCAEYPIHYFETMIWSDRNHTKLLNTIANGTDILSVVKLHSKLYEINKSDLKKYSIEEVEE